jgi:hypothetical protein
MAIMMFIILFIGLPSINVRIIITIGITITIAAHDQIIGFTGLPSISPSL